MHWKTSTEHLNLQQQTLQVRVLLNAIFCTLFTTRGIETKRSNPLSVFVVVFVDVLLSVKRNQRNEAVTRIIYSVESAAIHEDMFRSHVRNAEDFDDICPQIVEENIVDCSFEQWLLKAGKASDCNGFVMFHIDFFKLRQRLVQLVRSADDFMSHVDCGDEVRNGRFTQSGFRSLEDLQLYVTGTYGHSETQICFEWRWCRRADVFCEKFTGTQQKITTMVESTALFADPVLVLLLNCAAKQCCWPIQHRYTVVLFLKVMVWSDLKRNCSVHEGRWSVHWFTGSDEAHARIQGDFSWANAVNVHGTRWLYYMTPW